MNLKKILAWALSRAKEPSTYVGAATVAAALGANQLGVQIGQVGQIVGLIVGGGLVAATTKPMPTSS